MTYQPERDGYNVAHDRAGATEDERPIVVEDDGTTRTVESMREDDRHAEEMRAQEARTGSARTDGMGTPIDERSPRGATDARIARDTAIVEGRHNRDVDAEAAHAVVADDPRIVRGRRVDTVATPVDPAAAAVARERAEFGGIKWGSAFFGWLTAMGLAVVLTALVAAAGTALGLANDVSTAEASDVVTGNPSSIGIAGAIAVLLIMLVSYFAGGYVASRMARLDGARQGFAVWLWSIAIAAVLGLVALVVGDQYDVLGNLNAFPRVPLDASEITALGAIALVLAVIVSLVGAILGGMAGMNYHRRLDAAAFDGRREVIR